MYEYPVLDPYEAWNAPSGVVEAGGNGVDGLYT